MTIDIESVREKEFPWAARGEAIYLNNASTGPLPQRVVDTQAEWNRRRMNPQRIPPELQFGTLARARELIARLVGASADEIAIAANTTFGINLAAFSLPLKAGDVVLSPNREFPANVYPWMQLAKMRGVEYRQLECEDGVLDPERLQQELRDPRVKAVTVSWVQFASGARVDLAALGTLCRDRGVYFVVDAIQGLGPLTLDLAATPIDILTCGAQKWLLGPWGTAFTYVRRELIAQLEPHDVSWFAVSVADDLSRLIDYDLTWRNNARRFEMITLPYHDVAGMVSGLELLLELGLREVSSRALELAHVIVDWAVERKDVALITPVHPSKRAAIISVRPRDAAAVSARLNAAQVVHSLREGSIRLSPYFYNTRDEVVRALQVIEG